jgi:short-subunit dehydrogenase
VVPINAQRPLALVTGASSGIGRAVAGELVTRGHDVLVAADDDLLHETAAELEREGASVTAQQVDLATAEGVERLHGAVQAAGRPLSVAVLNAGTAASGHFARTPLEADLEVVDLNVRSVVHLTKLVLPAMLEQGSGRLLFTASIAGLAPGPYQVTYAASKAFVHLFAEGLRHELKGTGVTVTSLRPGPTDTLFFERAGMEDTVLNQIPKDDVGKVARQAVEALFAGKDDVVSGSVLNRAQALGSGLLPDRVKAYAQAFLSKPRQGDR